MLKEVQDIIQRIADVLKDNNDFSTEIFDEGVGIQVISRNGPANNYHGYELYLMEEVVKSLGHTLDFKIIDGDEFKRFVVTTDANFNLQSYINSTNLKLRSLSTDELQVVYICEKLTDDSRGEFSILTAYTNGTWTRCDITKAELLYAAVNNLPIEANENGIYWYPKLIEMNGVFFDELSEVANG
ncbi:hypothetical protein pEaSNUABM50_00376 [Erwinia phage pEa_SNUABM_50]|uniref:Uncharacterized protein n=4 Tax=Eneladusvirus BF TaxID=2560751 RepID=A0A7L8ZP98_9CAUD|nr:hypothetical protein FDH34_gp542 [Serratia phage BF]QOI71316.1 hypothetical protein pEaSNUABM12_00380 [Erwinia phage pEa_SNUABM_12]QOI71859.1 hypothetical protein pEaSNUABM47_00377 [Erwinia phage pEa_SNUABM_47]QOI72398.1 hypothetical protein pEaSNUABM50_00376 [Erwinia phage pEa_SNUABM_50]QXO11525.1 hypothetical protein pEaSNUABM19_00381 [Erwinia phage pEa_SNUABM_19]QXO12073.1 hypothetical protein pEaSNUABM44_00379 [Erwinia phage pEa_SNUABM_44]QXO12626.1 hypothetical protein pEaSNUABM49_003